MASSPITSWEIDGETVSDFIFLGSQITALTFPGDPVVKTLCFQCRQHGFNP